MAGLAAQTGACTITPVATGHKDPKAPLPDLGAPVLPCGSHPTQARVRRAWSALRRRSSGQIITPAACVHRLHLTA